MAPAPRYAIHVEVGRSDGSNSHRIGLYGVGYRWMDAKGGGRRRLCQRHFAGDGLTGALHHERQRHDMGLTIHYQLATTAGDEANARMLVQQLRQAALDLPFRHVGDIFEFADDQCDYKKWADDDPYRWLLIQARTDIPLPVTPAERHRGVRRDMEVVPRQIIAFETEPGDGCEQANFGLCRYPGEVSDPTFGKHQTKLKGWSWHSFCKTHYASDPRCGGLPNFLCCHLGVVALLDEAQKLGVLGTVSDEGDFWETRSLERLTKEIGDQSAMLAGLLGVLKDIAGQVPGAVEAPIAGYPNFEHLEAEGQRLLPEQLKAMLKALAQSNLLRWDTR